ncbi:MAG: 50S ribosomal protein L15 [Planctomycetes bacterium]|nr:50S ribosomal protein L15 [Planctomycetota bacterium]NOG54815.1 50S ribosomal protein L15 [Planctomycetota bacterium]
MMIHEITEKVGRHKARKRVGRGQGSGHGKTCGRGHKGAKSRAGWSQRFGFEGGRLPYFRQFPKRGFSNEVFRTAYQIVNVEQLDERFEDGATVDAASLVAVGLVRNAQDPVKILGQGDLTKKLAVTAAKFSGSAKEKIEAKGGSVTEVTKTKWVRTRTSGKK